MDWESIETFLKGTIEGMIVLGGLGSGLVLLILNIVGRANMGIKKLWIFYNKGNQRLINRLVENPYKREIYKILALVTAFNFLLSSIVVINSEIIKESTTITILSMLSGVFSAYFNFKYCHLLFRALLIKQKMYDEQLDNKNSPE